MQLREVAIGAPDTHNPAVVHTLVVVVPLSVPLKEHVWPPGGVQVPLQTVLVPHEMPLGLKVQLREVAAIPVTKHAPAAEQVLEFTVPASVPVVEHTPPAAP